MKIKKDGTMIIFGAISLIKIYAALKTDKRTLHNLLKENTAITASHEMINDRQDKSLVTHPGGIMMIKHYVIKTKKKSGSTCCSCKNCSCVHGCSCGQL